MTWQKQKPKMITLARTASLKIPHSIFCQSSKIIPYAEFVRRWKHSSVFYLIRYGNATIGYVLITTRNEIGYFIIPKYQRRHFGTEAVKKLFILERRPYYWAMIPHDKPHSVKFAKSLGFHKSGLVLAYEPPKPATTGRMGINLLPKTLDKSKH